MEGLSVWEILWLTGAILTAAIVEIVCVSVLVVIGWLVLRALL